MLAAAAFVSIMSGFDAAEAHIELTSAVDAARSEMDDEAIFVAKINTLRSELGLPALSVHPELVPLAREWAVHLRSQGSLSHTPDLSTGITVGWSRLGENVGVAPAGQIDALFDAFVASPSHYENLIKPDYRHVGIGVVYGADGRIWTSHRFMALYVDEDGGGNEAEFAPPPSTIAEPTPTLSSAPSPVATTPQERSDVDTPEVTTDPAPSPATSSAADLQLVAGVLRQLDELGI